MLILPRSPFEAYTKVVEAEYLPVNSILNVILPVFLILGAGYAAGRTGIFKGEAVDGLMRYAQNFAAPILLFKSLSSLNLHQAYDVGLLSSFYIGALTCFAVGLAGAIVVFRRPLHDAVAIGFGCLFSNTLLLGLPITERAYGSQALAGNYAIISLHAPLLYTFGILWMEIVRARGHNLSAPALAARILRAVAMQPLFFGISAGFLANISGLPLPGPVSSAAGMIAATTIPTALFGLGAVLARYSFEGDKATIAMICGCSLLLHPALTYSLGRWGFHLGVGDMRSAVVTSAMAPGVNVYLFSHYYGVAKRVSAAAVVGATALSIATIPIWLHILP